MSLIRPDAAKALNRIRDVLIGFVVVLLGIYWGFFTGGGLLHWFGYLVIGIGAILVFAGVQRARFKLGDDGPGIVQVVEGRVTYFGPLSGGGVDLEDLAALSLDPTATPPHWLLKQIGQQPLAIPLTARGADALFDAFASLPGIKTEHMLRQMQSEARNPVVIWRAEAVHAAAQQLH